MLELMQSIKPYFHCLKHFAFFSILLFVFWFVSGLCLCKCNAVKRKEWDV